MNTQFYQNLNCLIQLMPGLNIFKSTDLKFFTMNYTTAACQFLKYRDTIAITDYELKCHASEYADIFRHQDRMALAVYPSKSFDIMYYTDEQVHTLFIKKKHYQG